MKKPTLLAPVGSFESLAAALHAGADAVYFGVEGLNMRSGGRASFTLEEVQEVVLRCHDKGIKAYLTLNVIVYDNEKEKVREIISFAKSCGVDAVIAWDLFVLSTCNEFQIPVHISTQGSIANSEALAEYVRKYNAECCVLARELDISQIKSIIKEKDKLHPEVEIECFIHGAMCIAVSGRCFMSQISQCKSANRGECLQMCRRSYVIKDEEEGTEYKLENNYVMSPKDLCALPVIDKVIDAGINVLKIEGRARSPEYVKVVVEGYREAIDLHAERLLTEEKKDEIVSRMERVYNKGFSTGFYNGRPMHEWAGVYGNKATTHKQYVGKIINWYQKLGVAEVAVESNNINEGDEFYVMGATTGVLEGVMPKMVFDEKESTTAEKGDLFTFKCQQRVRENDKLYVIVKND